MGVIKAKVHSALISVSSNCDHNLYSLIDRSVEDKSMRSLLGIYDEIDRCIWVLEQKQ